MKKVVFLDRDGVINKKRNDYVKSIDEFEILDDVFQGIKLLNKNNFLVIIITNQSVINRKIISEKKLKEIHQYFKQQLESNDCVVNAIYYCPHKPDELCECRKPRSGLITKAMKDFRILKEESWLIGDSESDIQAAKNIGIKAIKMKTDSSILIPINQILQ